MPIPSRNMPQILPVFRPENAPASVTGARKQATPLGFSQSPETRGKEAPGEDVVSPVVSSEDLQRAIRILEAVGLDHAAHLLRALEPKIGN